jgi:hypothetical protein
MNGQVSQPRAGRGSSGWVRALGLGCGFVAFGGLCVLGLSTRMLLAQADEATSACTGFLGDLRRDDFGSAFQRMGADYQADFDAAHLRALVGALGSLRDHDYPVVSSVDGDDGRATVEGSLYGTSFGEALFACELSEREGYWYIDLVVVDGTALE